MLQELVYPIIITLVAMIIPVAACIVALFNEKIARTRYISTYLIYYLTISLGILAVVALALARVIDGSVCAALLGGIFGYVLGKQVSKTTMSREDLLPTISQDDLTSKNEQQQKIT